MEGQGQPTCGRERVKGASLPPACCGAPLMSMLILCRVGAQPPTEAEEGACLGECPRPWSMGYRGLPVGWVLTGHGAAVCAFPQWT